MERLLDPKNDWAFRQVFGQGRNRNILIKFLNDILGKESLDNEQIIDLKFLTPKLDEDITVLRPGIIYVLCKTQDDTSYVIGIQRVHDSAFREQVLRYAGRAYFEKEGIEAEGYQKIRPVIHLAIMETNMVMEPEFFMKKRGNIWHDSYIYYDVGKESNIPRQMLFSFIDLSKFYKRFAELETDIDRWMYFLKHADRIDQRDLGKVFEEGGFWGKAYRVLERSVYSPEQLWEYERYEIKKGKIRKRIYAAIKDGKAEGKAEMAIKVAKKMLSDRLDINLIKKYTGLSVGELEELK